MWVDCCPSWQWMVSRGGTLETAQQSSTLALKNSCFIEWKFCLWVVRDWLTYTTEWYWQSACFCDNTAPNPNLLVSVSRRNGLSKSAKANTRDSRQTLLRVSKVSLASAMSIICSLFLQAPSPDGCSCKGCATHANPLMNHLYVLPSPRRLGFHCKFGVEYTSATAFWFSLLGQTPSLETWWAKQLNSSPEEFALWWF